MTKFNYLIITALFLFVPIFVQAASLSFSQPASSCIVGSTCTVSIRLSSTDQAINAADGIVSFPTDKLEVQGFSKSSSIFNLWAQEPSFSNTHGTISFEGIVLNPGFTGSGTILSIIFHVKTAGTATLTFSSGSVLANDGLATNVLKSLGTAQFTLKNATPSRLIPEIPAEEASTTESSTTPIVPTLEITVPTEQPAPFHFSERMIFMSVTALLSLLVLILLFIIWRIRRTTAHGRVHIYREVREADAVVHKAFDLLREDIVDHMHGLEKARTKRALTRKEEKILKQFRKNLDDAEKAIHKEIRDIVK